MLQDSEALKKFRSVHLQNLLEFSALPLECVLYVHGDSWISRALVARSQDAPKQVQNLRFGAVLAQQAEEELNSNHRTCQE